MSGTGFQSSNLAPRGRARRLLDESRRKVVEDQANDVPLALSTETKGGLHKAGSWKEFSTKSLPAKLRRQDTLEQRKSQQVSLSVSCFGD